MISPFNPRADGLNYKAFLKSLKISGWICHFILSVFRTACPTILPKLPPYFPKVHPEPLLRAAIALCQRRLDYAFYDAVEPVVAS